MPPATITVDASAPVLAKVVQASQKGMTCAIEVSAKVNRQSRNVTIYLRDGQVYAVHSPQWDEPAEQWARRALGADLPDGDQEPEFRAYSAPGSTVSAEMIDQIRRDWAHALLAAALTWHRPNIKVRKRATTERRKFAPSHWQRIINDVAAAVDTYQKSWAVICQALSAAGLPVGGAHAVAPRLGVLIPGDPDFHDFTALDTHARQMGVTRAAMVARVAGAIAQGNHVQFSKVDEPEGFIVPEALEDPERPLAPAVHADMVPATQTISDLIHVTDEAPQAASVGVEDADDAPVLAGTVDVPEEFQVTPDSSEPIVVPDAFDALHFPAPSAASPLDEPLTANVWPPIEGTSPPSAAIGPALVDGGDLSQVTGSDTSGVPGLPEFDPVFLVDPPEAQHSASSPAEPHQPTGTHRVDESPGDLEEVEVPPVSDEPRSADSPDEDLFEDVDEPFEAHVEDTPAPIPAPVHPSTPQIAFDAQGMPYFADPEPPALAPEAATAHPTPEPEPIPDTPREEPKVSHVSSPLAHAATWAGAVADELDDETRRAIMRRVHAATIQEVAALATQRDRAEQNARKLADQLTVARSNLDQLRAQLDSVQRDRAHRQAAHESAQAEHERRRAAAEELRHDHQKALEAVRAAEQRIEDLLAQLAQAQVRLDEARGAAEQVAANVQQAEADLAATTQPQVTRTAAELSQFDREALAPALHAVEAAEGEVAELAEQYQVVHEEHHRLDERVARANRVLDAFAAV